MKKYPVSIEEKINYLLEKLYSHSLFFKGFVKISCI